MTSKVIAFLWNYLINENLPLAFRNIQQICRTILVLLNVSHYVSLVLLMLLFHGLKGCISRLYTESFSISFAYLFTLHMVYVIHLLPLSIHTFGDNNFIHAHKHTFILYFVNYLHLVKKNIFFFVQPHFVVFYWPWAHVMKFSIFFAMLRQFNPFTLRKKE